MVVSELWDSVAPPEPNFSQKIPQPPHRLHHETLAADAAGSGKFVSRWAPPACKVAHHISTNVLCPPAHATAHHSSAARLRRRRHIGACAHALLRSAERAGGRQRHCSGCRRQAGWGDGLRGRCAALSAAVAGLAAVGAALEVSGAAHLPLQAGRQPSEAVRLGTGSSKWLRPCAGQCPGRASATVGRAGALSDNPA